MDKKELRNMLLRLDWALLLPMVILLTIGVFFIYSAGFQREDLPVNSFHQKQLVWILVGFFFFFLMVFIDYRSLSEHCVGIYIFSIVLLVLVFFIGVKVHGTYRWIKIAGINIQPSEAAKISVLLTLSAYLGKPGRLLNRGSTLLGAAFIAGLPLLLIAAQPDLGTSMVILPVFLGVLFAAGLPWRILGLVLLIGLLVGVPAGWLTLENYQRERIITFFQPDRDPQGAGWNKLQSEISVGSGGMSGKGYLNGTQNILGFLPRTVAPTDFIFSVIAEETGFVGSVTLIGLYAMMLLAVARSALRARDALGRYISVGVLGLLFTHVFINIAMTAGLMPITGLPLPLISYGGSFMVSTMIALGLTQSVYVRRHQAK